MFMNCLIGLDFVSSIMMIMIILIAVPLYFMILIIHKLFIAINVHSIICFKQFNFPIRFMIKLDLKIQVINHFFICFMISLVELHIHLYFHFLMDICAYYYTIKLWVPPEEITEEVQYAIGMFFTYAFIYLKVIYLINILFLQEET